MKHNLKFMVICFLKALPNSKFDQFNQAFDFYKQHENKNILVETRINRAGFSEEGLENLLYDLKQLYGITDLDIANAEIEKATEDVDFLEEISSQGIQHDSVNELAHKVLEHTDFVDKVPDNFKMINSEELQPLRTEFPFLNNKDCPEIMFVVVGKRISAYRRYQELHAKLQDILSKTLEVTAEDQALIASETQEANAENLALWNELNHFNKTGEILGKHPLFRETVAKKEVELMTNDQLAKYRTSSATFFSKKRAALKAKNLTPEKKAEIEQSIADREYKLSLVNAKLGVDGTK